VVGQGILPLLAGAGELDAALLVVDHFQGRVGGRAGVFNATDEMTPGGWGTRPRRIGFPREQGAGGVVGHDQFTAVVPNDPDREVEVIVGDGDAA